MSSGSALHRRLSDLFLERLNLELPDSEIDLVDEGLLDSLAIVELMLILEEEFGVVVSVEDLEIDNLRSIVRIADFVARRAPSFDAVPLA